MPELQDSTRRWSGYVCPDCRFVFRVAREHDGRGVVCPSCKRLLKLPQPGDAVPPLLATLPGEPETAHRPTTDGDGNEPRVVRRRRKKRSHRSDEADWEASSSRHGSTSGKARSAGKLAWFAGLALVVFLALVLVIFLKPGGREDPRVADDDGEAWLAAPGLAEPLPVAPAEPRRSDAAFVAEARPVVEQFLDARTVEAVLGLVDQPEVVAERIVRTHPDGTVEPPGLSDFGHFSQLVRQGAYGTLPVRTRDFEVRWITLRENPAGLKVDWESWVGWSDMPWDEFAEGGASSTGVFRVMMRNVEYYNFDFTDDRKWQSYRLDSPDREHSLYGYVERDSLAHARLRAAIGERPEIPLMLELRHPASPRGRGQVVIERVVSEDWINPERRDGP